jgi:hypothetical protein
MLDWKPPERDKLKIIAKEGHPPDAVTPEAAPPVLPTSGEPASAAGNTAGTGEGGQTPSPEVT